MIAQPLFAASATSDALFIVSDDGRSVTVQHTIASDGPLVALDIPVEPDARHLRFLGPNKAMHQENAFERTNPIQLWDGVALIRYQYQYEDELLQTGPNTFQLSIPSLPQNFAVENGDITRSSYTWVFPNSIELTSYSAISEDMGRWQLSENELSYEQTERFAVTLTIEYKTTSKQPTGKKLSQAEVNNVFCFPTPDNPDLCAKDIDNDSVPDYRDVCRETHTNQSSVDALTINAEPIAEPKAEIAANATAHPANKHTATQNLETETSSWTRLLGCDDMTNIVLKDVRFPSGFSYLDIGSREALDRLAEALQRTDQHFEIGAHTDNAGQVDTNLALAKKRSETVRYYLLLRGVNPNQIRAKGYGEQFPLFDNATSDGRLGNRRIELTLIQKNQ